MLTDIEIARSAKMRKIVSIANELDIPEEYYNLHGKYIAKVSHQYLNELDFKKRWETNNGYSYYPLHLQEKEKQLLA